ncbi:hypothetical protein ACER0C_005911 [Sarotherodon galilaeus]
MCVEGHVLEERSCREASSGEDGDWKISKQCYRLFDKRQLYYISIFIFTIFTYVFLCVPHTNSSDCNALIFYICPYYWLAEHKDSSQVMSIWSYVEQVLNVVGQRFICCFVHCLRSSEVNQIFKFENI